MNGEVLTCQVMGDAGIKLSIFCCVVVGVLFNMSFYESCLQLYSADNFLSSCCCWLLTEFQMDEIMFGQVLIMGG